jgi:pyridoxal phosphate enzyme (YggS family)
LIAARLAEVRRRIDAAAVAAGRDPATVTLVAVSKNQPAAAVAEAVAAGQRVFGENRAQELVEKADALGRGVEWHFIGHLQRNKVRLVVGRAVWIHSVDSLALAEEIGRRSAGRPTSVLVQVNTSGEATKSGCSPAEGLELCRRIAALDGLVLRGLMTIPAPSQDPEASRPAFQALRALAEQGRSGGLPLDHLSMGMSDDLEVAIAEGSTFVRVGTAVFGPRA